MASRTTWSQMALEAASAYGRFVSPVSKASLDAVLASCALAVAGLKGGQVR
jgi:hypothetical protein